MVETNLKPGLFTTSSTEPLSFDVLGPPPHYPIDKERNVEPGETAMNDRRHHMRSSYAAVEYYTAMKKTHVTAGYNSHGEPHNCSTEWKT